MNRKLGIFAAALACFSCFPVATTRAWNSAGHMIVALIAHSQMSDATKAKANELLRAHPRFDAHFERKMPRYMSRSDDQQKAQWYFAHAGTWPDLVRDAKDSVDREDVNRFNRPYWHFINMPIFLNDAEQRRLESGLKLYVSRQPPDDPDETGMNIIQAVKNSSRIVGDANAPANKRAVHLCWLIHLAGDSHQPLHAGALYTANRFPRGDEGGNQLEAEHDWKLHAFWDAQVCTQEDFGTLQTIVANLVKNEEKAALGQQAASSTDIENWIDESHDLAKRFAYTNEVLQKVAAREAHAHLGPLDLSPGYRTDAESLAERRALEAGFRLAKVLDELLQ
jgi:hypothetical protein